MSRKEEVRYCKKCNKPIKIFIDELYDTWHGKRIPIMIDPTTGKMKISFTSSIEGKCYSKGQGFFWLCSQCDELNKANNKKVG